MSNYPAGAEHDPRAPWNEKEPDYRVFFIGFKIRFYGDESPEDFLGFVMERTDMEDDVYDIEIEELDLDE